MTHIRLRATIKLTNNQVVDLPALRPLIERAIASALPADLCIDTIKVTRINEAPHDAKPPSAHPWMHTFTPNEENLCQVCLGVEESPAHKSISDLQGSGQVD